MKLDKYIVPVHVVVPAGTEAKDVQVIMDNLIDEALLAYGAYAENGALCDDMVLQAAIAARKCSFNVGEAQFDCDT